MLIRPMLMTSCSAVLFAALANADSSIYVVTGAQQFGTVDLASGRFTPVATTPESDAGLLPGPNGSLYSLGTASGDLVSISPANGATTVIGPTGLGTSAFSLGEVNGKLYLTDFNNNLYTVNATTGSATRIGPTGIPPDPSVPFTENADGTINFCDENLYGMGNKLYATFDSFKVDPATLKMTMAVNPNLWQIDPATGRATLIAPTASNLDTLFGVNGGFYATQLKFVGFSANGPESLNELLTFNLGNGKTNFIRDIDTSAGPIFGATAATPEPGSVGMVLIGVAGSICWIQRRRSSHDRKQMYTRR